MKNRLYLIIAILFWAACSKHDAPVPPPPAQVIITNITAPPKFKTIPVSANQLNISFQAIQDRPLATLSLQQDTTTIGTYPLNKDQNSNYAATINFNFNAGQSYKLIVESSPVNDTIYRYTLPPYTHIYTNPYSYQKLLGLNQSLGPEAFDISPSRKYLYISDDINNTIVTRRLSLQDLSVQTIGGIDYGLMIRAVSDNEILFMSGLYNGRVLGQDSNALVRYNISTGQKSFVDFVSNGYGRFSRVVDNHILVTNPYYAGANSSLINLTDNSKLVYPGNTFNFTRVAENNFDHIYYTSFVVDPFTGALQTKISLTDNSGIEYIDSATGFIITSQYQLYNDSSFNYNSRLAVYAQNNLIYQGDFVHDREFQIGRQLNFTNNHIVFYQYFGFDTTYRIDGYYLLDLATGKVSLVQCDSNPSVIDDFQMDAHTSISVRADGVYRIIMP